MTLNPPLLPSKKAEIKPNSKKEQEQVKAVDSPVPENTAVLPIALPTTENSVNGVSAHKVLQEVAELHAKLQASLVQQVGSRTSKENLIKGSQLDSAILNGHCKQKKKKTSIWQAKGIIIVHNNYNTICHLLPFLQEFCPFCFIRACHLLEIHRVSACVIIIIN